MIADNPFAAVQCSLKNGPLTLDQLLVEYTPLWQQLNWQRAQVSLWLACLPQVLRSTLADGERVYALTNTAEDPANFLGDALVALLHKAGRPLPLAQLLSKFPAGQVVTGPMLRAAVQQDSRLELKGPLLKLAD
jgi:hypothetical protein